MLTEAMMRADHELFAEPIHRPYDDPLDPDAPGDEVVATTRRSLVRLALVAAETASRFAREGEVVDPVAWMLAPRRLFDGRPAVDACLGRSECMRAVILHGLSIGMDADPDDLDALIVDDESDDERHVDEDLVPVPAEMLADAVPDRPRLWTSLLVDTTGDGILHAFDAVVAGNRSEAEARVRARHGPVLAADVELVEGFDARLPMVEALVSPAVADMLEQVARDPASPLAEGLAVSVQQRFAH